MLAEQTYIPNVNYLKDTENAACSDRVAVAYLRYVCMVIANQRYQSKILLVELGDNSPTVGLEPTTTRLRALRSAD